MTDEDWFQKYVDVNEALFDLVTKLEIIHDTPQYKAVWAVAQMHIGPYTGPNYTDELKIAREVLGEKRH